MSVPDLVSATPVHVCVVYHSAYGHTAKVAQYIAQGAEQAGADVHLISVAAVQWDLLDQAERIWAVLQQRLSSLWKIPLSVG